VIALLGLSWLLFAAAAWWILVSSRRPSLSEELARSDAASATNRPTLPAATLGASPILRSLRPGLERSGAGLQRLLGRAGLSTRRLEERLALAGKVAWPVDPVGDAPARLAGDEQARRTAVALHLGQRVACGVIGFVVLPISSALWGVSLGPAWLWLVLGVVAAASPDASLRGAARRRELELEDGVVGLGLLLSVAVSGGMGVEQALRQAMAAAEGTYGDLLRQADRAGRSGVELVAEVARRTGHPQAGVLAATLRASERGTPLEERLRVQAFGMLERRRQRVLERSNRAVTWMVVTTGLLAGVFFVLLGYPALVMIEKSL